MVYGSEYNEGSLFLGSVPCGATETTLRGLSPPIATSGEIAVNRPMEQTEMPALG